MSTPDDLRLIEDYLPIEAISAEASREKSVRKCLEGISLPTVDFTYQSQHAVPGHPYAVSVVRALQPPGPKQSEFGLILDIDAGTTRAVPCDEAVLHEHLRAMHWLKNKVFFNLLLPDATEKFKKGTP